MNVRRTIAISSTAVVLALVPASAFAGHGADDAPRHHSHGADDAPGHHRHGADDGPGHHRHGADDGPHHH